MSHGQLALLGLVITVASSTLMLAYLQGSLPKWGLTVFTAAVSVVGLWAGIGLAILNGLAMGGNG